MMDYLTNGIMILLSFVSISALLKQGRKDEIKEGLISGLEIFMEMLPVFLASFIIAGIALSMVTPDQLSSWLASSDSVSSVFLSGIIGAIAPTSPIVLYPIAGTLYNVGTPVAVVISFIAGFSLVGIGRSLVFELPFMGMTYVIIRSLVALVFPVVIALIVQGIM